MWKKGFLVLALALAIVTGREARAQQQSGSLSGVVRSDQGEALAGVTVTLSGIGAAQMVTTSQDGRFRFLGLAPGEYGVRAELENFVTVDYSTASVSVGRNTQLELRLTPRSQRSDAPETVGQTITDIVTITAESPLLDTTRLSPGANLSSVELEKIPTARDPWALLQQAPGVLIDRVNVAGGESGQQAQFISPGTSSGNSAWLVDGVMITDMSALGGSSTYYNFDILEAAEIATGGSDAALSTAGVTMNLVTKRGTNEWRFSARYFDVESDWQSNLSIDRSELAAAGPWNDGNAQAEFERGNRLDHYQDYGVEGGGPLQQDHLWAWGSWGVQDIGQLTIDDVPDTTEIENFAAKINAQITPSNSLTAFYHLGDKTKDGRDAGPTRPRETTFQQSGPTSVYKIEDTHLFTDQFFLSGMASYVDSVFTLDPIGGGIGDLGFPNVVRDEEGIWRNSFVFIDTDRPQKQARLEGNAHAQIGGSSHELRFGAGYRQVEGNSFSTWPGQQLIGLADIPLGDDVFIGISTTETNLRDRIEYWSLYAQDTLSMGHLTANVGLRYDLQTGSNLASSIARAPIDADGRIVGGDFAGAKDVIEWRTLSPRLGLTYALGESQTTLLRASLSRFADQLGDNTLSLLNPAVAQSGTFLWLDQDGDRHLTDDEVGPFVAFSGLSPVPGVLTPISLAASDLNAPVTDELVLAVEHALRPELVIGLSATARRYSDILENERLVQVDPIAGGGIGRAHQRSDYVLSHRLTGSTPDGRAFDVPVYSLAPGLGWNGGVLLRNGEREQEYLGISASVQKRLANRWMMRGHVTWSDWSWNLPERENEDPTNVLPGLNVDGGAVLQGSGNASGLRGDVFINSNWAYDLTALYQVAPDRPWGFNLSAELSGREGYPVPYNVAVNLGDDLGTRNVLAVDDVERFRNPDLMLLSARIEKEITVGELRLTLGIDGFNLLNDGAVLQRATPISGTLVDLETGEAQSVGSASGAWVREVVSPRAFRLGARLSFR